jgi:hypothetical protein
MSVPGVTLSGTLNDVAGNGIAGTVIITLCNFGANPPEVTGSTVFAPVAVAVKASNTGFWTTKLWGNDQISPVNTFYQVQVDPVGSGPAWSAQYIFNSGTYDLSTQSPVSPTSIPAPAYVTSFAAQSAPSNNFFNSINSSGVFGYGKLLGPSVSPVVLVADGATDNYSAIANAIAALPSDGGVIWLIPDNSGGECYVSQSIVIQTPGVTIRGCGWSDQASGAFGSTYTGTVLLFAAGQVGIRLGIGNNAPNCIIRDLTIASKDAGATSAGDYGIWMNSSSPKLSNVGVHDFGDHGVLVDSSVSAMPYVANVNQWQFSQVMSRGNYGDGFHWKGGSDGNAGVATVCVAQSNTGWGFNLLTGAGSNTFLESQTANNTAGGYNIAQSSNCFINLYCENDSTPSNLVVSGNNNYFKLTSFGQPATITNTGGPSNVFYYHDANGYSGGANLVVSNGTFATASGTRTYILNNGGFNPKDLTIQDDLGVTWFNVNQNLAAVLFPKQVFVYQLVGATNVLNQNSPILAFIGQIWNGSVSTVDEWQIQTIPGTGTNPSVALNIAHSSGTSGQPYVNFATPTVTPTHTPSSSSDTGITGQWAWDATYIYICTATNTWKRVTIATW